MFELHPITSLDLPELAPYRTLKRSAAHAQLGIFVVEGDKVLDRLLESDFAVVSVLLVEERLAEYEARLRARPEKNIAVYVCPRPVMAELTGFEIYQGVLAIAKMPAPLTLENILAIRPKTHCDTALAPSPRPSGERVGVRGIKSAKPLASSPQPSPPLGEEREKIRTVASDAPGPRPRLFVALDGLASAENVGLLMRNCAAFGVTALITGETCCSPFLRRTVRNSMGTIFKLPVMESANLVNTLRELRGHGVRCLAAHPHTDQKVLSQADFSGDCCIVFGSEGSGISPEVLAACDEAVVVPMANEVDSLNVSVATAVFLYEANRQRGKA